jgi:alpha-L-arabinofuranosidase
MLGVAMVNWEHAWGKPFPDEVPGLAQAMKEQGVSLLRYAGGLWANNVGFDRTTQRVPYEPWEQNGETYYFHYGTDELASLDRLADAIGADVIIQVNVSNSDPVMWADMVRYTNVERGYGFKYWELGNEYDLASDLGVDPDTYAARIRDYMTAMKAVDPSIEFIAGVSASFHDGPRLGYSDEVTSLSEYLTKSAAVTTEDGEHADSLSYHWYQTCNSSEPADMLRWTWDNLAADSWRNAYARIASEVMPSRVEAELISSDGPSRQGITELNFDACNHDSPLNGNHLNAIWASDIVGRLAYNGLDFLTWYEGYAWQSYSAIFPDHPDYPTRVYLRPSYYAFFMYNKYFGDTLVESSSIDEASISVWASIDSDDPGKLKLRITNLTDQSITVPVYVRDTHVTTGEVFVLESEQPTDIGAESHLETAPTTINGVQLDGANVAASAAAIEPVTIAVNGSSFSYTFPAFSSVALVLDAELPGPR